MRINLSKSKKHLIFNDTSFDKYGLPAEQKRAAVEIDPTKDPDQILAIARTFVWEIEGEPSADGWYPECTRTGEMVEEQELQTITAGDIATLK